MNHLKHTCGAVEGPCEACKQDARDRAEIRQMSAERRGRKGSLFSGKQLYNVWKGEVEACCMGEICPASWQQLHPIAQHAWTSLADFLSQTISSLLEDQRNDR